VVRGAHELAEGDSETWIVLGLSKFSEELFSLFRYRVKRAGEMSKGRWLATSAYFNVQASLIQKNLGRG
jgi:hypothetical protein